ncbi:MAG: hypothetical protein HYT66_00465 [Candidatus Yanofskybacteria bacterium]|nr:hypothetical protein [Candidatus Yanofskybacteria bacterium]
MTVFNSVGQTIASQQIGVHTLRGGGGGGGGGGGNENDPIGHLIGSVINVEDNFISGTFAANITLSVSTAYDNAVTVPAGGRLNLSLWCPKLSSSPSPFSVFNTWPNGVCSTNDPTFGYILTSTNLNNFRTNNPFTFTLTAPDGSRPQSFTVTWDCYNIDGKIGPCASSP